jgi:two-component system, OmpR family, phosphate regulon response regulator PhoB
MARLLVVDGERDVREVLEHGFRGAGYEVTVATRGAEGFRLACAQKPDVVLLDVMLPDMLGTEVCRMLKGAPETRSIAVVMVTAKGDESDRVAGFELGADDYVVKPFSMRELILRVGAILRRGKYPTSQQNVEFGALRINQAAHRVWVAKQEVALTAIEFRLLLTLLLRRNRVQTRAALLKELWQPDAHLTPRTIDAHVKRLREKLGSARDYIETVRGLGYRFVARPTDIEQ